MLKCTDRVVFIEAIVKVGSVCVCERTRCGLGSMSVQPQVRTFDETSSIGITAENLERQQLIALGVDRRQSDHALFSLCAHPLRVEHSRDVVIPAIDVGTDLLDRFQVVRLQLPPLDWFFGLHGRENALFTALCRATSWTTCSYHNCLLHLVRLLRWSPPAAH